MNNATQAWRSTVCGYIHRGAQPPDECPVCGSPKERFEPYTEIVKSEPAAAPQQWRCLVCNYQHAGDTPPDTCPVCATPGKQFEAVTRAQKDAKTDDSGSEQFIVVGSGIAGVSAIESIRQASSEARITMLTKDAQLPYYRLNLTRFLAGELTAGQLLIHKEEWYQQNNIRLITGAEVSDVLLEKQEVTQSDGEAHHYDKLVLTAGAHPFIPPIPGARMEGVTTLRTMEDAKRILEESEKARNIVIIGGGVLGLEAAGALAKRKRKVMILESFGWLMPRQLNRTAARLLKKHIESIGVSLKSGVFARELLGDEHVTGVLLKSGETIPADLVIITAGVRSNSYIARLAGLHVNQGIIVNDHMQTSDPNVYAAGDIAEHRGIVYGLWNAAQFQGSIAGMNAIGNPVEFGGIPRSNSLKVLGADLLSIGKFEAEDGGDSIIEAECEGNYARFVFRDAHLVGSILYGNTAISGEIKSAIENKFDCSGLLIQQPSAEKVWNFFVTSK